MTEVYPNLFIGDDSDCKQDFAVIHACKSCFMKLHETEPYLAIKQGKDIYLNIVDAPEQIHHFIRPIIDIALNFINTNEKVLIHCNKGESRSPSIAMLYMAIKGYLPNKTYNKASEAFRTLYPSFSPNKGIETYIRNNWKNYVI